jgi:hypothetical protein
MKQKRKEELNDSSKIHLINVKLGRKLGCGETVGGGQCGHYAAVDDMGGLGLSGGKCDTFLSVLISFVIRYMTKNDFNVILNSLFYHKKFKIGLDGKNTLHWAGRKKRVLVLRVGIFKIARGLRLDGENTLYWASRKKRVLVL